MADAAVTVVERYLDEVYHQGLVDVVRQICADPLIRHEAASTVSLTHDAQVERITADLGRWQPWFTHEVLAGDGRDVVLVWNAAGRTVDKQLCGIEVFRVVDGRITDVWNAPYMDGHWA